MLETTFRSIIQFRQHNGSIHARTHAALHTQATQLTQYTESVAMVSVCFLHVPVTSATRVCYEWKGTVTWAARRSVSSGATRPLRSNNTDSQHQRPPLNLNHFSLALVCILLLFPVSLGTVSKKDFNTCLNFHCIISIGVTSVMFMKHAEGPGNLQPFGLYFLLPTAKFRRGQIKCTVMWYYRIYYGCDQTGQLSECC